jgi:hypothetical protein
MAHIIALQATLLVGAYEVFHLRSSGFVADVLTGSTGALAPLLGVALLVAYLAPARRRVPESREPSPVVRTPARY